MEHKETLYIKQVEKELFKTPEKKQWKVHSNSDYGFQVSKGQQSTGVGGVSNSQTSPFKELLGDRFIPFRTSCSAGKKLFDICDSASPLNNNNNNNNKIEPLTEKDLNEIAYTSLLDQNVLDFQDNNNNNNNNTNNNNNDIYNYEYQQYLINKNSNSFSILENDESYYIQQQQQQQQQQQLNIKSEFDELKDSIIRRPKILQFKAQCISDQQKETKKIISASPYATTIDKGYINYEMDELVSDDEQQVNKGNQVIKKISKHPIKVLDAPSLKDDFYLNLIDWSSKDILAVALGINVYSWNASTGTVDKLAQQVRELSTEYTAVSWEPSACILGLGTSNGVVELWDAETQKLVINYRAHNDRIATLSWANTDTFSSGSRDKQICTYDLRCPKNVYKWQEHKLEVCGLKWSPNEHQLASGGNDNKVMIWSLRKPGLVTIFKGHKAAVKAITWNTHADNILLSGGGSYDQTIKIWNTVSNKNISSVVTGSQVCNMVFSKSTNEFVTSHGFSNNQIIVWRYPNLTKKAILEGHSSRVLHLCLSENGKYVVSGAGDETIKLWDVFPVKKKQSQSKLFPSCFDIR